MVRTVISMAPDDKAWLEQEAALEQVPMSHVVQRALARLREQQATSQFDSLMEEICLTWDAQDGRQPASRSRRNGQEFLIRR